MSRWRGAILVDCATPTALKVSHPCSDIGDGPPLLEGEVSMPVSTQEAEAWSEHHKEEDEDLGV